MQKTNEQILLELDYHNKNLKDKLLPSTQKTLLGLQNFYIQQKKDYVNILKDTEEVLESFRGKLDECEGIVNQIVAKKQKDSQFTSKGQGFLHAKGQQIKSKVKNIDAVSSGIKETVAKVKVDKLVKLPVKTERALGELFRTIYQVLYEGQRDKFEWEKFRDLALKHQDGQDFIFRLVNVNFKDLKEDYYNDLLKLKSDPEFDNICLNTKFAHDILDLADWVEYVCVGRQFAKELKDCNKEYDKIRKDIEKRSKGSLQMSQKFWRDASEQIDGFQNSIEQVRGEIKAIQIGMNRSVENIQESLRKRNNKIVEINAM